MSGPGSPSQEAHVDQPQDPIAPHASEDEPLVTDSDGPKPPLLEIPSELIQSILSYLSPYDLCSVSATCWALRHHAMSDIIWKRIIQSNVRASPVRSPYPCDSFHRLYAEHDRLWFLPRYKIWFCNRDLPGKMILVRYDDRRGCIEGLELLAVNKGTRYEQWQENNQVTIHTFEPIIRLHIDRPILQFKVGDRDEDGGFSVRPGANRFADEMPMVLDERLQGMFSNFLFNKPLAEEEATARLAKDYPYGDVWPPPAIPARQRTRGTISGRYDDSWLRAGDRPLRRDQVSENTFSIRRWIQRGGVPMPPLGAGTAFQFDWGNPDIIHMHMGEEIMTFATLDPALYTPTPTRPWRGIWVGDYSAHGCEFLLIHQPDEPEATDAELGLSREEWECDEAWEKRRLDARINRGRLEAIKLTGDPNVPRGEHTFIADDIGPDGFVGVASEPPFKGARMVRSRGHIAHTGFVEDKFIESQLLLLGPDRLAQYWVRFGHISFFERVHIDKYLNPDEGG